jgi:bifunctional DNase/RNase
VLEAVDGLPAGQSAAVLLFYLAGLSHTEVATRLGIETGAVKTRLHKARVSLKRVLSPLWEELTMTAATDGGSVDVRVAGIRRRPAQDDSPALDVIFLEQLDGGRTLPIWIGPAEGEALAFALEQAETPRPMTYGFMASLLEAAGARLREVVVSRLTDDTYFAEVVVEGPTGDARVDARPSDAITLALVAGAPIRVERAVFDIWEAHKDLVGQRLAPAPGEQALDAAAIVAARRAQWEQARRDARQR